MEKDINKLRREIQLESFSAWKNNKSIGFVKIPTGNGKSWVIMDALSEETALSKCILLSETRVRDDQYYIERKKYMEITGNSVTVQPELETYQKAYRFKDKHYDLVIADEADFIGLEYSLFFNNNTYDKILLLSATRSESVKYGEGNAEITKGEILDNIAPLVYEYTISESIKNGTNRELDIVVYRHILNESNIDCSFPKSKKTLIEGLSEQKAYNMYNWRYKYVMEAPSSPFKVNAIKKWAMARARFLYGLPSKVDLVKKLLSKMDGKTLILGNSLDALYQITQNTLSSRNSNDVNKQLLKDINSGAIDHIAADKMITRGANIPKLDNIILLSYQASSDILLQKLGRLRLNEGLTGKVHMFLTVDTQEEMWFEKIEHIIKDYNVTYKNSTEI